MSLMAKTPTPCMGLGANLTQVCLSAYLRKTSEKVMLLLGVFYFKERPGLFLARFFEAFSFTSLPFFVWDLSIPLPFGFLRLALRRSALYFFLSGVA